MLLEDGYNEHNAVADQDADIVEEDVEARPGLHELGELGRREMGRL